MLEFFITAAVSFAILYGILWLALILTRLVFGVVDHWGRHY